METNAIMDVILGIIAISILAGGLFMVFSGVREMNDK